MPKAPPKKKANSRETPLSSTSGNASRTKKPANKASNAKNAKEQPNPARSSADSSQWNYLLLIAMTPTDPQVNRLLSLPPTLTFAQFHAVLQISFGWANSHSHAFNIHKVGNSTPWGGPLLTSLVANPMGIMEDMKEEEEADWTLADVYEKPEWKDKVKVTYEYDMGDSWEHSICLLGRQLPNAWNEMGVPEDMKAICLSGQGHPVAEDSGGFGGWEHLQELFAKPRMKDEDDRKGWYENFCSNGDKKVLNSHEWDMMQVNTDLSDIGL